MLRDPELQDIYEDFKHLLQIDNKDPQENIRIKKLCTAIMTLARVVDRLAENKATIPSSPNTKPTPLREFYRKLDQLRRQ